MLFALFFFSYYLRVFSLLLYIFQDIPEKEVKQTTMDGDFVIGHRNHYKPGFFISVSF
jgi:hypothetical protein